MASGIIVQSACAVNPPDADFNPDCGGNQGTGGTVTVAFIDNSTGVVNSYAWDFGDGTTSTLKNPNKTYAAEGNYTVKHTVRNSAGWDSIIKGYSTACPHPLIVDFYAVPTYGAPSLTVYFTDNTDSVDPATNTYFWEFGDGGTSTELNPVHTYTYEGSFTVNLTVTEKNHHHETLSKQNYIYVGQGELNPDFTGDPRCGPSPLSVHFTDITTLPHDYREWNFGDGGSSNLADLWHTYSGVGDYTVELFISETNGGPQGWIIRTDYIHVIPNGVASFTATPTSGSSPLNVQFTDTSTGFISPTYYWEFGDGTTSNLRNPSHTFETYEPTLGYPVKLTVTGYCDQTSAMTQTITVTSSVLEFSVLGTIDSWSLSQGSNTNNALSMTIKSNRNWKVSAYDALLFGKPSGTVGKLAEYAYSYPQGYVSGGKSLSNPLHVHGEVEVSLDGTQKMIWDEPLTPSTGSQYDIDLIQNVVSYDYTLGTNRGYRTVITFVASQYI